eukprot:6700068-Prymnesium_polylepis.1
MNDGRYLAERDDMIRHIDTLLRHQPPPPDAVLEKIVEVLQRSRGHSPPLSKRWHGALDSARKEMNVRRQSQEPLNASDPNNI